MHRRALPAILAAALCLALFATPALAQLSVSITLSDAPPPPRHQVMHKPRPGWVWVPGTWYWEDGRHRWDDGRWIKARRGQQWVPARWERRDNYYRFVAGGWAPEHRTAPPAGIHRENDGPDGRYDWHDKGRGNDRYGDHDSYRDNGRHDNGHGKAKGRKPHGDPHRGR